MEKVILTLVCVMLILGMGSQSYADLGDTGADLIYTPVSPCRIIDTRVAGGPIAGGYTRNFLVVGATGFDSQGGNPGGCNIPEDATSVMVNFIAVGPPTGGHMRAWPYGGSMPNASIINFVPGVNIANGLIQPICNPGTATCTFDLTIYAASPVQVVADVTGYFRRFPIEQLPGGSLPSDSLPNALDGTSSAGSSANYSRGDHKHGIASGAITNAMIGTGAVSTVKIGDGQVTNAKITGPIDGSKIGFAGLNADTVDGQHSNAFASSTHNHDTLYYTKAGVDNLISNLQNQITALQNLLQGLTRSGTDFVITNANLYIQSGSGATDGGVNGKGNLIIGYNERRSYDNDRTGSHNLIVGSWNNYSSYGGIVVGKYNTISGIYSSVSGGFWNTASGDYSSVSGGDSNKALGSYASVSGGNKNTASGPASSVSGGWWNFANGDYSSVSGGNQSHASGYWSSVSGGIGNTANGSNSSVSGGHLNTASGDSSSVSGGSYNTASGDYSYVAGGGGDLAAEGNQAYANYSAILGGQSNKTGDTASGNKTIGENSTVSGGISNTASGDYSSVTGGNWNTASGEASSISGGDSNKALGYISSVSGGGGNQAQNDSSSISGGWYNVASGPASSVSGGYFRNAIGQYDWAAGGYWQDQ